MNENIPAGWSIETLKVYLDTKFEEADKRYQQRDDLNNRALQAAAVAAKESVEKAFAAAKEAVQAASLAAEKSVQAALAAAEKAIEKAEKSQQLHNQMQNEWRGTVADVTKSMAETARHESSALVEALSNKTDVSLTSITNKLTDAITRLDKRDGGNVIIAGIVAAAIAVVVGVGIAFLSPRSTAIVEPQPQIQYAPVGPLTPPAAK